MCEQGKRPPPRPEEEQKPFFLIHTFAYFITEEEAAAFYCTSQYSPRKGHANWRKTEELYLELFLDHRLASSLFSAVSLVFLGPLLFPVGS